MVNVNTAQEASFIRYNRVNENRHNGVSNDNTPKKNDEILKTVLQQKH